MHTVTETISYIYTVTDEDGAGPEDDEYMYDDDIILEEETDEMDDDDDDDKEHFPESEKVYQIESAPAISTMDNYATTSEDESGEGGLSESQSTSEPAQLGGATTLASQKSPPTKLVHRKTKKSHKSKAKSPGVTGSKSFTKQQ
ncbi:hypothetical protein V1264_006698 [Littorina saxatilis]|uniref:Uncharacterized protein n=1 Tax=Littorina saxatilis TaxID=31220 RepID=A0AAN9G572_9CAEN